ncbi:plastid ribosomal protein L4 [Dunaliella salina]|uniref:Large ribosomal subunit protein uL4c n=1 Tax=Dunaliella salina TaxID=3046 RepID=A0ABQ7GMY0_DUNSA|nr:plastid ribosomal protein L4 [Dunaliella salina]|eukprot:KAF5835956.1 plastid ribosomal protein L4 [Dunaliella salina]
MLAHQRLPATSSCVSQQPLSKPAALVRPTSRQQSLQVCNSTVKDATVPMKDATGADKGEGKLALKVAEETAKGLVHRYLVMVQQNKRRGTASTLTRAEVRGGGKKPMVQKGTGNARRGSSVSPLFPGGGITFGPKPKDWSISMNKKERRLALATALQSAADDMIVVENLDGKVQDGKTKTLLSLLRNVGADANTSKVLLITNSLETSPDRKDTVIRAGRNVEKLYINTADKIRVFDLLKAHKVVVEEGAFAHINSFYGPQQKEAAAVN